MSKTIEPRFGQRIKRQREKLDASQADLAKALGLKDRQSVSQIEAGQRRITADELLKAASFFGISMEDLANPFLLASEKASFSWRQQNVLPAELCRFEQRAGEWIGAYRELNSINGERLRAIMPRLGLTHTSALCDAVAAGDDVACELKLGDVPSKKLAETLETRLGILVLMVDAIPGVSGAACRLPELNAILINRNDSAARRNYDLAHELFHIMTWDTMPPARLDGDEGAAGLKPLDQKRLKSVELLAQNFAAGLLMPSQALDKLGKPHGDVAVWLAAAAYQFGVSGAALKYRMKNAGRLSCDVSDTELMSAARCRGNEPPPPPLFSRAFITTISTAIAGGNLSSRRAAALLDMTTDEVGDLCDVYSVARPEEI